LHNLYNIYLFIFGNNNNKFEMNFWTCKFFVEFFIVFWKNRILDTHGLRTMFENWLIWTVWELADMNCLRTSTLKPGWIFFQVFETLPRSVKQIKKKKTKSGSRKAPETRTWWVSKKLNTGFYPTLKVHELSIVQENPNYLVEGKHI
jgi:hypothetical protein